MQGTGNMGTSLLGNIAPWARPPGQSLRDGMIGINNFLFHLKSH